MSAPNFSLGILFEVENSAVNEHLGDKTQLTEQEVNIFVEEQRNQKTVKKKKKIKMLASLSSLFKSRFVHVFLSV